MMKHFTFLGYSEPTIAMLMESIYSVHGKNSRISIIQNTEIPIKHPFEINGIDWKIFTEKNWKKNYPAFFALAVGKSKTKSEVFNHFKSIHSILAENYTNIIHASAQLAQTASLGFGNHIQPLVTIAPYVSIGNFVSVNRNANIGHHTVINDFCTISPSAAISGFCTIGEGVSIGTGAMVIDNINIGKNSFVGSGSVVTKDIPENVLAYGNPAKVVRDL